MKPIKGFFTWKAIGSYKVWFLRPVLRKAEIWRWFTHGILRLNAVSKTLTTVLTSRLASVEHPSSIVSLCLFKCLFYCIYCIFLYFHSVVDRGLNPCVWGRPAAGDPGLVSVVSWLGARHRTFWTNQTNISLSRRFSIPGPIYARIIHDLLGHTLCLTLPQPRIFCNTSPPSCLEGHMFKYINPHWSDIWVIAFSCTRTYALFNQSL